MQYIVIKRTLAIKVLNTYHIVDRFVVMSGVPPIGFCDCTLFCYALLGVLSG